MTFLNSCIILAKECVLAEMTEELLHEFNLEYTNQGQADENIPPEVCPEEGKLWTPANTLFLISVVKEYDEEFSNGIKKMVWPKVATKCAKKFNKNITAQMCETKWKTLKRTYKTIVLHNDTSGQRRRHWEYYNVMNEILAKKPEITPTATCSGISGLHVNKGKILF